MDRFGLQARRLAFSTTKSGDFAERRMSYSLHEIRYKVINRETIQAIYSKSLLKRDEFYYKDMNISPWLFGSNLYYVPADSLPSSDCWLKEERWIWRNEQDWRDYKEKIKQKKKKK